MDYDQQIQLAQQRQRDAMSRTQFQAPQGRMVSGIYVAPNPLEYLSAALRSAGAGRESMMAQQEAQQASEAKQKALSDALRGFTQKAQGTPAQPEMMGNNPSAYTPAQPAQAPDMAGAFQSLLQAPDAGLRQMGMQGLVSQATPKPRKMERVELPTPNGGRRVGFVDMNAPNPLETFVEAGTENAALQVGPGGQAYNPRALQPGQVLVDPNKPFQIGADGKPVANAAFQSYETTKAAQSAPRVNVTNRIENKGAESIVGQVGPILKESSTAAEGAAKTLDAANRIVQAIDTGKVIAGPLANARVSVAQAAQLLGVGGRNNAEMLANTRATIRGLAEMTLQGRKQMSGQGAITESESKLAEKAVSGDITDLTPAEIRQLAEASRRASQWTIQTHQQRVDAARRLPGMEGFMPFFTTSEPPAQAPATEMPSGFKVVR